MKPFDLHQLMARYNRRHPRKTIALTNSFGLTYLNPDGLAVLNNGINAYNMIKKSQPYRVKINSIDKCYQSLTVLKQSTSSPDFFAQAKQLCSDSRSHVQSAKLKAWETNQVAWLSDEKNWQRLCEANPEVKGSLVALKTFWDRQKFYVLCSNDFLLQAITELWAIEQEVDLAELEFRQKSAQLPAFIAKRYNTFLTKFRNELTATKTAVLNTMLSRLTVADKTAGSTGHYYCDDTLVYTIQELQRLGAIKATLHASGYWQTLEPKHFNSFQRWIQMHGNSAMNAELSRQSWFCESKGTIETQNLDIDHQRCIVPTVLVKHVPKKKNRPAWLFSSQHRCIEFIQQQQSAIANLKLGLPPLVQFEPYERFQVIDRFEQHIKDALAQLDKHKPRFWQLSYRRLLSSYKELLFEQAQHCQHERIKRLEEIAHHERAPEDREERYQLWLLLREQLRLLSNTCQSNTMATRLINVEVDLLSTLKHSPTSYATCLIQALAENQELTDDELNYLCEFIEINALSPDKDAWLESIQAYCTPKVNALLKPVILSNSVEDNPWLFQKAILQSIPNTTQHSFFNLFRRRGTVNTEFSASASASASAENYHPALLGH